MSQWQRATLITSSAASRTVVSLSFTVENWQPHQAGQFYDVSVDGGITSRCYSVASAPETVGHIELGVELFEGGAVSPKLCALTLGQTIMVRGPHGLPIFTWNYTIPDQLVVIGGGSGMVPLMSMVRHYAMHHTGAKRPVTIISSSATASDLVYHQQILQLVQEYPEISYIPIATQDMGWQGRRERIDQALIAEVVTDVSQVYMCGSFEFVATVSKFAESIVTADRVHWEYFG